MAGREPILLTDLLTPAMDDPGCAWTRLLSGSPVSCPSDNYGLIWTALILLRICECRSDGPGWTAARIGAGGLGDSLRIWPLVCVPFI
jgi:hypothetical protein